MNPNRILKLAVFLAALTAIVPAMKADPVRINGIETPAELPNYTSVRGRFEGFFFATNTTVAIDNVGFFRAKSNPNGTFSGVIQMADKRHPISGRFSPDGTFTKVVHRNGSNDLNISLRAGIGGGYIWEGVISSGAWSASLTAVRNSYPSSGPFHYHMNIVRNGPDPITNGIADIAVRKAGSTKITGTLGDGTKITSVGLESINGQIPFFSFLYSKQGYIYGWLNLGSTGMDGTVDWFKPAGIDTNFPNGISVETTVNGTDY
jgi:hypothetical protein